MVEKNKEKRTHLCGYEGVAMGQDNGEWVCMYCVRCFCVYFYFYKSIDV